MTLSGTKRVSEENTASPESGCFRGFGLAGCGWKRLLSNEKRHQQRDAPPARTNGLWKLIIVVLLRRRIVTGSPECVQRGQSPRLYKFYLNLPVRAIASLVAGALAEHILIAQFDADFGRHVGQFGEVFHDEVPAAGGFGDIGKQTGAG